MNWGLIGWVVGCLLTIYVLKFVVMALRSLFSKESMENLMDWTGTKVNDANKKLTETIKRSTAKRKAEKRQRKMENDQPMVIKGYIR